ncbi:hypothetical protein [Aestuariivirga litoralis]|uniref:hypothetical protein n=1 Tax=Aestuariivirga litoralis TaxID=2650924 RepID=UPI0018C7D6B2|nr:hypothetical protein [Aestuariivirga litoralis]MBG1232999.1 hypothetical protein [Aestuariivirga litoralis]
MNGLYQQLGDQDWRGLPFIVVYHEGAEVLHQRFLFLACASIFARRCQNAGRMVLHCGRAMVAHRAMSDAEKRAIAAAKVAA